MKEYIYFCTSLPCLQKGAEPPLSKEAFLNSASTVIEAKDYEILQQINFEDVVRKAEEKGLLADYYAWEIALRNQVISQRLKILDPKQVNAQLRPGAVGGARTAFQVEQLLHSDPLETESALDAMRWDKLSEIEATHQFDLVFLAVYLLKLQLLERLAMWQVELGRKKYENISQALAEGQESGES